MDCFMAECFFYNTNVWRKEEICKVLVCFMSLIGMVLLPFLFSASALFSCKTLLSLVQNILSFERKHCFLFNRTDIACRLIILLWWKSGKFSVRMWRAKRKTPIFAKRGMFPDYL